MIHACAPLRAREIIALCAAVFYPTTAFFDSPPSQSSSHLRMVTTVSNRARTTAAALGLNVDAILAQHFGQILSVKDVEAYARWFGASVCGGLGAGAGGVR